MSQPTREVTIRWGQTVLHVEAVSPDGEHRLGGPCRELWGDALLPISIDKPMELAFGDGLFLTVSAIDVESARARWRPSWRTPVLFTLSVLVHAALVIVMFLSTPALDSTSDETNHAEQQAMLPQLFRANALREDTPQEALETAQLYENGMSANAPGEPGSMGDIRAEPESRAAAVRGYPENPIPGLASYGVPEVSFVCWGPGVAPHAGQEKSLTSPWADTVGTDPSGARGNLSGDTIGDSFGAGGLDLSGVREGAGARDESRALGHFDTISRHGDVWRGGCRFTSF